MARHRVVPVSPDAPAAERTPAGFIDPAVLMRIRRLELRARIVVQGFWSGLHKSPHHGFSVEFTEYRAYSPGDDLRYLDWRLFARSDRYFIKRFEDETNLRCHLLVDQSKSMSYGSLAYTKAEYASTLAATLAYFLIEQRDAVGLMAFSDQPLELIPARFRPGQLHRLMVALERPAGGASTNLVSPLNRAADLLAKRGLVILISDLLAPVDDLAKGLSGLVARGHEVVVFQILDPAEIAFAFDEPILFFDLETGSEKYIDPSVARSDYLQKMQEHQEAVTAACLSLGVECRRFTTDNPLELALFDCLLDRIHQGRRSAMMRREPRGRGR